LEKPIAESYWVIPGFFLAGEYPAARMDDQQTRQRLAAFITAGFDTFLDLTCEGERTPYLKLMIEEARTIGLAVQYQRFSFPDFSAPSHAAMRSALNAIDAALADHHCLYLHCVVACTPAPPWPVTSSGRMARTRPGTREQAPAPQTKFAPIPPKLMNRSGSGLVGQSLDWHKRFLQQAAWTGNAPYAFERAGLQVQRVLEVSCNSRAIDGFPARPGR
jgi:hypothetical protein